MKYLSFEIKNYRAISGKLNINIEKNSLLPIIGINECGKTTILQAIFSFDYFNDKLNNGVHLRDVQNLFSTDNKAPIITATIGFEKNELYRLLKFMLKRERFADIHFQLEQALWETKNITQLRIDRSLQTMAYSIKDDPLKNRKLSHQIAREILKRLPYTFYFDDFRDSIEEEIEIKKDEYGETTGWLSIIEELFTRSDENASVFKLGELEARKRKKIISKVERTLNEALIKEWQDFKLDDRDALKIEIEFDSRQVEETNREYIKLGVIEKDENEEESFFFISDRSKGFFWFFNFVMKLEFNPKSIGPSENECIYLLDEPGSYLHASAQSKLCAKLRKLSKKNKVIYCTHSHYLLNPEVIPVNNIRIAEKNNKGEVTLQTIHDYGADIETYNRKSAFQPILDSLNIKPYHLDLAERNVLIVEGIFDYYAFEMFKGDVPVNILPAVGADSIKYHISHMIAWDINYRALWDNDDEGRTQYEKAVVFFGKEEAKSKFWLLDFDGRKNAILQNLIEGDDMKLIKSELEIPSNSSFQKVMMGLYFSDKKKKILKRVSAKTKDNFTLVLKNMKFE